YHKGKLTIQQISEAVLIKTGSITYVIDQLEMKGWLKREPCQKDRRVVYIQLTNNGKQIMEEIFPKHWAAIEEIFSVFSEEEKEQMIENLEQVGQKAVCTSRKRQQAFTILQQLLVIPKKMRISMPMS